MANKDPDLFDRLRQAGLRKQAAKTLSEVSESAGKKAERTARAAVKELRALADEIERRLPAAAPASDARRQEHTKPAHAHEYVAHHKTLHHTDQERQRKGEKRRRREAETTQFDPPDERPDPLPSAFTTPRLGSSFGGADDRRRRVGV
ncbi:MAG: hypothetical protein ACXVHX_32565 [Solirubrobacteraceae bacterium]